MSEPNDTKAPAANAGSKADSEQAHRQRMDELKSRTKRLKFGTRVLKNTGTVAERMLKNVDTP